MDTVNLKETLKRHGLKLTDLAKVTDVHRSQATRWAKKRVPAERVPEISEATGIPRHELRPDLYEPAQ